MFHFDNLGPGAYGVSERSPPDTSNGLDAAGPVGGTAHNPGDLIDGHRLSGGTSAEQNNFGELLPASISGRVFARQQPEQRLRYRRAVARRRHHLSLGQPATE